MPCPAGAGQVWRPIEKPGQEPEREPRQEVRRLDVVEQFIAAAVDVDPVRLGPAILASRASVRDCARLIKQDVLGCGVAKAQVPLVGPIYVTVAESDLREAGAKAGAVGDDSGEHFGDSPRGPSPKPSK